MVEQMGNLQELVGNNPDAGQGNKVVAEQGLGNNRTAHKQSWVCHTI